ncbi:uncharacterized protein Z520_04858 [Fonsecaea multimorphosa CBS 102226]|uniref:Uncharacterized protein n=1 Tax=Fonsecaea multimorphosa CBS 102226 TaxID=1442371 RepID=A0A0D2K0E4_9EURO|nr:uncharacterized protein Z520_04858 [Fonsecaea multimorphosa CBS 102226]KIX99282.1 hypothetical protein Z520_04858 [Fonsecaea multimorphosa CBS 102226]OAL25972.1 hypothetical protein AYO22_04599 [Fonsecaea multimorphosa]
MAPTQNTNNKQELSTKDAMFLLELMRDSPQPILFHIGPYCHKTGAKPNTIVKRLGEIKKRNGLNIVTTTSPPSGNNNGFAVPRVSSAAKRETGEDSEAKPKVKRERVAPKTTGKQNAPDLSIAEQHVKVETGNPHPHDLGVAYGLPSPAESAAEPLFATPTAAAPTPVATGANVAQIFGYMPQKRSLDDRDSIDNGVPNKKVKAEN